MRVTAQNYAQVFQSVAAESAYAPAFGTAIYISHTLPASSRKQMLSQMPMREPLESTAGWKALLASPAGAAMSADLDTYLLMQEEALCSYLEQAQGDIRLVTDDNEPPSSTLCRVVLPLLQLRELAGDAITINGRKPSAYIASARWRSAPTSGAHPSATVLPFRKNVG